VTTPEIVDAMHERMVGAFASRVTLADAEGDTINAEWGFR